MDFRMHFDRVWSEFTAQLAPLLISTLVLLVASLVSFGIMAPVCMAGYMQSLLRSLREDRRPEIRDLFACMHLFFPLLGGTILLAVASFRQAFDFISCSRNFHGLADKVAPA